MTLHIVIVNQSARLTDDQVHRVAEAMHLQFRDLAPRLERYTPSLSVAHGKVAPTGKGIVPLLIVDDADVAGALGYHDLDPHGRPYSRVFPEVILDNGGSVFGEKGDPSFSVSGCASHEGLEIWGNPWCGGWQDMGRMSIAAELADPVQAEAYRAANGVYVSNCILPAWWNPLGEDGPYDAMGTCTKPFELRPGGYWIQMADGKVGQQFADGRLLEGDQMEAHPGRGGRLVTLSKAQPDS